MYKQILSGRYLCQAYYRGQLKPSRFYAEGETEKLLARCVEEVIENAQPKLATTWAALLAGDLRRLNTMARAGLLGGGAFNPGFDWDLVTNCSRGGAGAQARGQEGDWAPGGGKEEEAELISIDGAETVRVAEICLYYQVGKKFEFLCSRAKC